MARSICSLLPGVPGLSERIHVRSIAGRFLEHRRLFAFEAGDQATYLLGSADIMPRNLDHRIEVLTPVEDARLSTRSRRSSTRCSATARRPGCSNPTARGRAFAPNGVERSAAATLS